MIKVELVTPQKIVAEGTASIVSIPGSEGDLGILVGHTPLLSSLRVGAIRCKQESGEESFFVSGGFVEVLPEKVTILAEVAEKKEDIDKERAQKSFDRARKRIDEAKPDINLERAKVSLLKAINRLKIAS